MASLRPTDETAASVFPRSAGAGTGEEDRPPVGERAAGRSLLLSLPGGPKRGWQGHTEAVSGPQAAQPGSAEGPSPCMWSRHRGPAVQEAPRWIQVSSCLSESAALRATWLTLLPGRGSPGAWPVGGVGARAPGTRVSLQEQRGQCDRYFRLASLVGPRAPGSQGPACCIPSIKLTAGHWLVPQGPRATEAGGFRGTGPRVTSGDTRVPPVSGLAG